MNNPDNPVSFASVTQESIERSRTEECGKFKFKTQGDAWAAAANIVRRSETGMMRVYWCKKCAAFHNTSQRNKS